MCWDSYSYVRIGQSTKNSSNFIRTEKKNINDMSRIQETRRYNATVGLFLAIDNRRPVNRASVCHKAAAADQIEARLSSELMTLSSMVYGRSSRCPSSVLSRYVVEALLPQCKLAEQYGVSYLIVSMLKSTHHVDIR